MQIYDNKAFNNPIEIITAFDKKTFKLAVERIEKLSKNYYLLGYIRYEAKEIFLNKEISTKIPLLYFEAYKNHKTYSPKTRSNAFVKTDACLSFEQYKTAISKIKQEISNGNTYEVNYTYDYNVYTDCEDFELYEYLLTRQKTPYNTFIKNEYETLLSFSPELFFELEGNNILTKPMKGTVKRGTTPIEDMENINFLKNDIKNRAENIMIVDLLRNDLSKIAKTGTVKAEKLFEIETHKTLHQMTSEITAELKEETTLYEILEAIFPCGSITGAPKISTMEIIDSVEKGKRNIYCGAIGFLSPEKSIFSVPIRILQKQNNETHFKYRVGGAIVWNSDITDEWEETITKMSFLKNDSTLDFKIIETLKAENGSFSHSKEHFDRMKNSAEFFGYSLPAELYNFKPKKEGMVRILLDCDGEFEIEYLELKPDKNNFVTISEKTTFSQNIFLQHKTSYRDWYKESFEKIKTGEIYDEIFFNEKGELTEGARTNIILQIDGNLFTPPLECGLLNGILRQRFLEQKQCTERILYKKDLENAEKIFCINSVRGAKEVVLI